MRCRTTSIFRNCLLQMEKFLEIIHQTACWRSAGKWLSLRVSSDTFLSPFVLVEGNACGNLNASLLSLTSIKRSSTMRRTSCTVIILLTWHVELIDTDATTQLFRIWRVSHPKFATSSRNLLSDYTGATPFVQISSCLSTNLGSGCTTTKPWSVYWTGPIHGFELEY